MGANSAIIRFVSNVEWPIAISSIREHASSDAIDVLFKTSMSDADAILKLLAAYAVQRGAAVHEC